MGVLFVEDSQRRQTYVGKGLRQAGYAVDVAGDGEVVSRIEIEQHIYVEVAEPMSNVVDVSRRPLVPQADCVTIAALYPESEHEYGARGLGNSVEQF